MKFAEKLDFLMNVTKASNSALSLYTTLDASYISRLRHGQRGIPKDTACIRAIAAYFSRHCVEEYQKKALCDALRLSSLPTEPGLVELICDWLTQELAQMESVRSFLNGFSNCRARRDMAEPQPLQPPAFRPEAELFYGVEGKRQAVVHFLSEVILCPEPQTLFLFSDEPMDWMTADAAFAAQWASLMFGALARGNRIKIIHTVSRNLDEMLAAISHWMPLYMTGLIEPYFYPKKRDGLFRQTRFIAPKTGAVISDSVGDSANVATNVLFRSRRTIETYVLEFSRYLALCRPLMRIFAGQDEQSFLDTLAEFEKEPADILIKTSSLSMLTMPEDVAQGIAERMGEAHRRLLPFQSARIARFEKLLRTNSVTEIIRLPAPEDAVEGRVPAAFSDLLAGITVCYTSEEFLRQLVRLKTLLETCPNFHVCFVADMNETRYMVYAKEDTGALVIKTSTPPVVLAMNESNMTAAFWDFLKSMVGERAYSSPDNAASAHTLGAYMEKLRACMQRP